MVGTERSPGVQEDRYPSAARSELRSAAAYPILACVVVALFVGVSGARELGQWQGWVKLLGAGALGFLAWSCYALRPWTRAFAVALGAVGLLLGTWRVYRTVWVAGEPFTLHLGLQVTLGLVIYGWLLLYYLPARTARLFELAHSTRVPAGRSRG